MFVMPDGETQSFDTFGNEGQQFVIVLGITPDKEVIIARQFRFGPEKVYDELPGGFVDDGEELETAALREFQEETGYRPERIEHLGFYHKDAYMNGVWHVFFATDCVQVAEQELEAEEHIEVHLISVDQLIKNGKTDKMTDAAAVLIAYNRLENLA
jgi:ADP-ribose pyrophosphatase